MNLTVDFIKAMSLKSIETLIRRFDWDLKRFFSYLRRTVRYPVCSFKNAVLTLEREWYYGKSGLRSIAPFGSLYLILLKRNEKYLKYFEKKYGKIGRRV